MLHRSHGLLGKAPWIWRSRDGSTPDLGEQTRIAKEDGLLAEAEALEDPVQGLLGANGPGDLFEVGVGLPQIDDDKLCLDKIFSEMLENPLELLGALAEVADLPFCEEIRASP